MGRSMEMIAAIMMTSNNTPMHHHNQYGYQNPSTMYHNFGQTENVRSGPSQQQQQQQHQQRAQQTQQQQQPSNLEDLLFSTL